MNSIRRKSILKTVLLLLIVGIIGGMSTACERAIPIIVVNHTDQSLTIIINKQLIGEVDPGAEIKNQNRLVPAGGIKEYLIEAKNTHGDTLYSRSYTFDQLIRDMNLTVTIPPLQNE